MLNNKYQSLYIVPEDNKELNGIALPVIDFDSVKDLSLKMIEIMNHKNGIGIAAPQLGVALRVIILKNLETNEPLIAINPEIINSSGWFWLEEGCLSLPGKSFRKLRSKSVEMSYFDINGNKKSIRRNGLAAACIQHEIDHLNGILINNH